LLPESWPAGLCDIAPTLSRRHGTFPPGRRLRLQKMREGNIVMMKYGFKAAILGLAGMALFTSAPGAEAREPDIRVLSDGENFAVQYGPAHRGNIAGGGGVRSLGGGENGSTVYSGAMTHQSPMLPQLIGGGEDQQITYSAPKAGGNLLATSGAEEVALAR